MINPRKENTEIFYTENDNKNFEEAKICHICEKGFNVDPPIFDRNSKVDRTKVRDHCHLSGRYRGAAHSSCNLQY